MRLHITTLLFLDRFWMGVPETTNFAAIDMRDNSWLLPWISMGSVTIFTPLCERGYHDNQVAAMATLKGKCH